MELLHKLYGRYNNRIKGGKLRILPDIVSSLAAAGGKRFRDRFRRSSFPLLCDLAIEIIC